jgi:hypothetical protein
MVGRRDAKRPEPATIPQTERPVVVDVPGVGRCIPIDRLIERDPRALELLDEIIESAWT